MVTHSELQKFGKHLQNLRKAHGFSQEELAERCGLHRTYIGGIERGERNVALLNILRIASALEVSPSELLAGMNNQ
jgi:transcriptional regulator with XRE-family HTH domain